MEFTVKLKFMGLCALVKKNSGDDAGLHVFFLETEASGVSRRGRRFWTHTPYICFNFNDLYSEDRQQIDFVCRDRLSGALREGFAIFKKGDNLGISDSSDNSLVFDSTFESVPTMTKIYKNGKSINPRYFAQNNYSEGIISRLLIKEGKVSGIKSSNDKFVFDGEPHNVNDLSEDPLKDGVELSSSVVVEMKITALPFTLTIGDQSYRFMPADFANKNVEITIANMPAKRLEVGSSDIVHLDPDSEDFDFELVYAVAEVPVANGKKPRVPRRKEIGSGGGTRPPMVCMLARYNDVS